ncbi:MAG: hypothetical protein FWG50_12320 [Kiritimatiellaeota bacterium]|nr:hypothetical protein [Kiritimatiellota bacterium]
MNANDRKYRFILIGIGVLVLSIPYFLMPWQRFRREPPSFYMALAGTCKCLLEREGLIDPAATEKVHLSGWPPREDAVDARLINFPDKMFAYSPRKVTADRNVVLIEFSNRFASFIVSVHFLPFRNNRWAVTLGCEAGSYLLWEGEDGSF